MYSSLLKQELFIFVKKGLHISLMVKEALLLYITSLAAPHNGSYEILTGVLALACHTHTYDADM